MMKNQYELTHLGAESNLWLGVSGAKKISENDSMKTGMMARAGGK